MQIQKQLYLLDKMIINYNDKKYSGSCFSNYIIGEYQTLCYQLIINYSLKEKLYLLFNNPNEFHSLNGILLHTNIDKNQKYDLLYNNQSIIKDEKKNEFSELVAKILSNKFVYNNVCFCDNTKKITFKEGSFGLEYIRNDCLNERNVIYFKYNASNDSLNIGISRRNFSEKLGNAVDEILNMQIPKNIFSSYIQNIIETSEESKKDIYIPFENIECKIMPFYINQERDNYTLVKKR